MTTFDSDLSSENVDLDTQHIQFTVLCVDDEVSVLKSLKRLLRSPNYRILTADGGHEGLKIIEQETIDIVISDMRMPNMDGAEFLSEVAECSPETVRLLLTGYSDMNSTIAAVNKGKISRYLQKPWNNDELLLTIEQCTEKLKLENENRRLVEEIETKNQSLASLNNSLENKVKQRTQQINAALSKLKSTNVLVKNNLNATIRSFYNLISLNPHLGGEVTIKISELCALIADQTMQTPKEIKDVKLAGLLCELGLLGLDESIWNTPFEELSLPLKEQYMRSSQQAFMALSPATPLKNVATIILHQHEAYSGDGLPDRLNADQIPLGSRILAVARDYVYATSGRLHTVRLSSQGAIEYLTKRANQWYDPEIVNLLPTVVKQTDHKTLAKNERVIPFNDITPGMSLSRDVLNHNNMLLLPEGHIFNHDSLARLSNFLIADDNPIEIFVLT